jgi:hypothetical protein
VRRPSPLQTLSLGTVFGFTPAGLVAFGRLVCNRKTRIHACWPGSLRRLDCNLNTCWQSSLRQLDCKPVTWIRLGLLVLLPSAVIKYVGLVSSMSLCNKVFYISQRSRNDLSMKGVWVVANIVNVY